MHDYIYIWSGSGYSSYSERVEWDRVFACLLIVYLTVLSFQTAEEVKTEIAKLQSRITELVSTKVALGVRGEVILRHCNISGNCKREQNPTHTNQVNLQDIWVRQIRVILRYIETIRD